jgi:hypothetical protein
MSNKTCGVCKHCANQKIIATCKHIGIVTGDIPACSKFEQRVITNGDVIRQDGNKAIAKFAYKTARTHICGVCAFSTIEQGRYVCTAKDGLSCVDGIEAYLNAPAESEGEDE